MISCNFDRCQYGHVFRLLRKSKGYSRPQVAARSGVPFYLVRNFELVTGRQPTNDQVLKLMAVVGGKTC